MIIFTKGKGIKGTVLKIPYTECYKWNYGMYKIVSHVSTLTACASHTTMTKTCVIKLYLCVRIEHVKYIKLHEDFATCEIETSFYLFMYNYVVR